MILQIEFTKLDGRPGFFLRYDVFTATVDLKIREVPNQHSSNANRSGDVRTYDATIHSITSDAMSMTNLTLSIRAHVTIDSARKVELVRILALTFRPQISGGERAAINIVGRFFDQYPGLVDILAIQERLAALRPSLDAIE